jgi:NTP pyrophosphatase (non-canonical NTP hydrolase)
MWYVAQATQALGVSFEEVIERNVKKLESRYPGGSFDVYYSENRKEGDL